MVEIYNQDNGVLMRNRFCHGSLYISILGRMDRGFLDCRFSTLSRQPPHKSNTIMRRKEEKIIEQEKGEVLTGMRSVEGEDVADRRPVSRKLAFPC